VEVAQPFPSTGHAQGVDAKIAYQVSGTGSSDLILVSGWSRMSSWHGTSRATAASSVSWSDGVG
jgi:hypothetical protein